MINNKMSWPEIKKKGKTHFIITQGVIGWGVTTAILFFIVTSVLDFGMNFTSYLTIEVLKDLLISLVIFPLVGIICGWLMWELLERKHRNQSQLLL
ncbi:hypothetical protein [Aquibacillus kalidii]|uniref:hypothetical protein n=1 Tax=Aquibacillus kalidii TaxID=2762597 RepID=UPI001646ED41|nr:hypothetical protein [Aquibacillus kalidii]